MEKLLGRIFISLEKLLSTKILPFRERLKDIAFFLDKSLIWLLICLLGGFISVKIFFLFALGTYVGAKIFVITTFFLAFLLFTEYLSRDFYSQALSWTEMLSFLMFFLQLLALFVGSIYDVVNYFTCFNESLEFPLFTETLDCKVNAFFTAISDFTFNLVKCTFNKK